MNLRVDLLLDGERRSASIINPKMLARVFAIVIPSVVVILFAIQLLQVRQYRRDLANLQLSYDSAGIQQGRVGELISEFQSHRSIQGELTGWAQSRIAWHNQLAALIVAIPTNVQLRTMTIGQTLQLNAREKPVRMFTVNLAGRAVGTGAEDSVRQIEEIFRSASSFSGLITNVTVPRYGADDSPTASRNDRVFEISAQFNPRVFE